MLRRSDDGLYVVRYTDNTEEDAVSEDRLRAQASQAVGGVLFLDEACVVARVTLFV